MKDLTSEAAEAVMGASGRCCRSSVPSRPNLLAERIQRYAWDHSCLRLSVFTNLLDRGHDIGVGSAAVTTAAQAKTAQQGADVRFVAGGTALLDLIVQSFALQEQYRAIHTYL